MNEVKNASKLILLTSFSNNLLAAKFYSSFAVGIIHIHITIIIVETDYMFPHLKCIGLLALLKFKIHRLLYWI